MDVVINPRKYVLPFQDPQGMCFGYTGACTIEHSFTKFTIRHAYPEVLRWDYKVPVSRIPSRTRSGLALIPK